MLPTVTVVVLVNPPLGTVVIVTLPVAVTVPPTFGLSNSVTGEQCPAEPMPLPESAGPVLAVVFITLATIGIWYKIEGRAVCPQT
jgi:hypothetical protein